MIAVIIAGGAGSRLWPLSTPDYPKHLLQLTNHKTLLQNTYERAESVAGSIYIISEASHAHHIYEQLPELPKDHVIVESARRGTASCVIAALATIKKTHNPDEPIVFMHADHHIRDRRGFYDALQLACNASVAAQRIVLLGVEPTYPATGFGYIQQGARSNHENSFEVVSFKEKPDAITAQQYLDSGNYMWNMGYFVAPLQVFELSIEQHAPHLWHNYQRLLAAQSDEEYERRYLDFANEPIDTALIEKVKDLLVVPGTFDWMDVGSYPDVHQVNAKDADGNTVQGKIEIEDVTNSFIRNNTDVPVAVIGLDNVAVVATSEGILVINKGFAQKVGTVSKRIKE